MECRDFRKMILPFFMEELDEKKVKKVLNHMEGCPDCREEMKIQYLAWEGRRRLSQGGNFDLQADYKKMLAFAKEKSDSITKMQRGMNALMGVSVAIVFLFLIQSLFL